MFPFEKTGKMPEATQALTMSLNVGSTKSPPHELLITCGRRSVRGFLPPKLVGASIHWPEASRADPEQEVSSQPLAAIHFAAGATPIWLPMPSSPTIVPIVWVPWPLLSHGASDGLPQTLEGSNQL